LTHFDPMSPSLTEGGKRGRKKKGEEGREGNDERDGDS